MIKVEHKCIREGVPNREDVNVTHFKKDNTIIAEYRVESSTIRFYNTLSLNKEELLHIASLM